MAGSGADGDGWQHQHRVGARVEVGVVALDVVLAAEDGGERVCATVDPDLLERPAPGKRLIARKSGNFFRCMGIFLNFVRHTTRTMHPPWDVRAGRQTKSD